MRTVRPSVRVRSAEQAERERLQRRDRGQARRARMEDRVEDGDALRVVEVRDRIVALSTHQTRPARPSFSGSSAAGPWRVKRS